jgi:hypothetical protein
MSEPIELLQVSDLMRLLKISRAAAYRLAESLGGYRIGRSVKRCASRSRSSAPKGESNRQASLRQ